MQPKIRNNKNYHLMLRCEEMFCDTMIQQTWPDNEIVFKLPDVLCLRS